MQSSATEVPLLVVVNPEEVLYCLVPSTHVHLGDFILDRASCFLRRGAHDFVEELNHNPSYRLAFWSSATRSESLKKVLGEFHVQAANVAAMKGKEHLVRRRIKDIEELAEQLGHPLERTVAVDIRSDRYLDSFDRVLEVPEYDTSKEPLNILSSALERLSGMATGNELKKVAPQKEADLQNNQ